MTNVLKTNHMPRINLVAYISIIKLIDNEFHKRGPWCSTIWNIFIDEVFVSFLSFMNSQEEYCQRNTVWLLLTRVLEPVRLREVKTLAMPAAQTPASCHDNHLSALFTQRRETFIKQIIPNATVSTSMLVQFSWEGVLERHSNHGTD